MRKKFARISFLIALLLTFASNTYAVGESQNVEIKPPISGLEGVNISQVVQWIVVSFFALGILAALFFILWGGLNWVLSGGDKDKVDSARSRIIAAIIGLIIIVLAYFVLDFVLRLVGFCGLSNFKIPSLGGGTVGSGCT